MRGPALLSPTGRSVGCPAAAALPPLPGWRIATTQDKCTSLPSPPTGRSNFPDAAVFGGSPLHRPLHSSATPTCTRTGMPGTHPHTGTHVHALVQRSSSTAVPPHPALCADPEMPAPLPGRILMRCCRAEPGIPPAPAHTTPQRTEGRTPLSHVADCSVSTARRARRALSSSHEERYPGPLPRTCHWAALAPKSALPLPTTMPTT